MAGHVYLIGSRKFHWYKIGKSADARIRVTELGILLPFRVEVIAAWKANNHHELERLLHEKYATDRINGEWFSFNKQKLEQVMKELSVANLAMVSVAPGYSNIAEDTKISGGGGEQRISELVRKVKELMRENAELRAQVSASTAGVGNR